MSPDDERRTEWSGGEDFEERGFMGCQRKKRVPEQFPGADGQPRGAKLCELFASYFMLSLQQFNESVFVSSHACVWKLGAVDTLETNS